MSEISRRCTTTHVTAELALALTQLSERLAGVPTQQMSEISRRCTTTHVTAELALALTQLSERL
ncbi:hypothetical protein J6590_096554 [Homalodisca vitripennis]|nr:hypothetical protein J6590_096554 [Homalodisca vitripennis]